MSPEMKTLNKLFETLPSGVLIYDRQGQITQMNSRAKELLHLPLEKNYSELSELPESLAELKVLLDTATEDISRSEINLMFSNKETASVIGFTLKHVTLEDNLNPKNAQDESRVFIFNDITHIVQERLAMDKIKDELFQSKKLASIGTMISGVAHELNNPLTGISMSTQLSEMILRTVIKKLDPKEDASTISAIKTALKELEKSGREAKKAAVLVSDLLNYSKQKQLDLSLENPVTLTEEMIQTLKSHPEFSQIKFQFNTGKHESSADILCDRIKIEQVFYNLFKNASDAMANEGDIEISFANIRNPSGEGRMIQISVIDNGPGMDKTLLSRIFDPFFTTKGAEGIGLGLSISFRTLEQHGGILSVESDKGQGACFHVALPLFEEEEIIL